MYKAAQPHRYLRALKPVVEIFDDHVHDLFLELPRPLLQASGNLSYDSTVPGEITVESILDSRVKTPAIHKEKGGMLLRAESLPPRLFLLD